MPVGIMRQKANPARTSWYSKWNPPADCVLWLPGQDDAQSAVIRDRSGYSNHGAITGATWLQNEKGLWGLNFDGANDEVLIAAAPSLILDTDDITILLWSRITAYNVSWADHVIGTYNANNGWALEYQGALLLDGRPVFYTGDGAGEGSVTGTAVIGLSEWTFVGVTWVTATRTVAHYLNGAANGGGVSARAISNASQNCYLGERGGGVYDHNGIIVLPRVLNRALSASEIAGIYNQERHLFGV